MSKDQVPSPEATAPKAKAAPAGDRTTSSPQSAPPPGKTSGSSPSRRPAAPAAAKANPDGKPASQTAKAKLAPAPRPVGGKTAPAKAKAPAAVTPPPPAADRTSAPTPTTDATQHVTGKEVASQERIPVPPVIQEAGPTAEAPKTRPARRSDRQSSLSHRPPLPPLPILDYKPIGRVKYAWALILGLLIFVGADLILFPPSQGLPSVERLTDYMLFWPLVVLGVSGAFSFGIVVSFGIGTEPVTRETALRHFVGGKLAKLGLMVVMFNAGWLVGLFFAVLLSLYKS